MIHEPQIKLHMYYVYYALHRLTKIFDGFQMILLLDGSSGKRSQGPPRNTLGKNRSNERQYVFDMTFGADSTQQEVYEKTTQPLVKSVLEGINFKNIIKPSQEDLRSLQLHILFVILTCFYLMIFFSVLSLKTKWPIIRIEHRN